MTWAELSKIHGYVARNLIDQRDEKLHRAVCTRTYYAAYAAITAKIPPGATFARGWKNPAHAALPGHHAALPGHVDQIPRLSRAKKDTIREALSRLRQRREDADYRPIININRATARESQRDLATITALLP